MMGSMRKFFAWLIAVTAAIFLLFLLYDHFDPVDLSKIKETSRVVEAADGTWLYAQTSRDEKWRFPVEVPKLDPGFLRMLLAFEDQRFYRHPGMDPLAMGRAVMQLISSGRIISGGSTITMQLARLLEPKPRTVWGKLREIVRAFQLEWHYSKEEILSAYLTLTPYGGNVEGIVGASMRYFGKLPTALSASESALLVALPQSPERNRPDRSLHRAKKARKRVLDLARERGIISETLYRQALGEPLPSKLYPFPRYAPHLSQKLLLQSDPGKKVITTTLNADLQRQVERWAKSKASLLGKETTLAVLVIRNEDAAILAYLGSHDMFSRYVPGHNDMTGAIRSPGSTLKPLIYALGFEKRLIHPDTVILDRETRFGDYLPHNFSRTYSGEVTVAYALQYSLNIPAVKILRKVGVETFVERLSQITGKLAIPKKRSTLPVALGGIGITMKQLAQLYVALANEGAAHPLHYLPKTEGNATLPRFCEPEAARMTTAILRRLPAPDGFVDTAQQIAYKTGTSYGYRDAWTIAYDRNYTVAVWVGKPSNATQLKRTGRSAAAPLAFELFALIDELLLRHLWEWPATYPETSVPPGLACFDPRERQNDTKRLKMLYPLENTRYRSADCSKVSVDIKVEDGKKPYYWYIDGEAKRYRHPSFSLTFDYGAHTITVIDSSGETITRTIWVDKPEC